jgi:N-acetylmuramoyl-L-alanine amidase
MELGLKKRRRFSFSRGSLAQPSLSLSPNRCFGLLFSLLLFGLPSPIQAGEKLTEGPSKRQVALDHFQEAVLMRTALESKPGRLRTAAEYSKVINKFRSVYYTCPASSKSDDSLMAIAELYQMMAADLKDQKYFNQAIKTYDFLQEQYPSSPYCPDAQFASAEIQLNDLGDPKTAQEVFKDFLKRYPESSKVRNARARLDDLREQLREAKKQPSKGPTVKVSSSLAQEVDDAQAEVAKKDTPKIAVESPKTPEPNSQGNAKGSATAVVPRSDKLVHVRSVRFWHTEQYSRFVIETDGETQTLDATLENPNRILLDIQNAQLSPDLWGKTFSLGAGPFHQLRCGQPREKVARIVLDVAETEKYHLSNLQNPYRIVLDVQSPPEVQTAAVSKSGPNSKRLNRGEPLADELSLASPFDAPVNLAHKHPPPAKRPAPLQKEEESKNRATVEEARSETGRKQVQVASKEEPHHNASKHESESKSAVATAATREAKPKSDGSLSLIRTLGLKIGRIVIDPGHGGSDNGTVGPSGLEEKELVLDVAFRLKKLVEEKLNGEVVMTRTDDTFIPLEERTAIANQSQADLFISIHANSSPNRRVSGVETFFLNFATSADVEETAARENATSQKTIFELQDLVQKIALKEKVDESREFAQTIQKAMAVQVQKTRANAKDRGVKQAPFIVLIGANMPSILSEISFVSNPSDERLLKSAGFRQKIAEALCHGIEEYTRNLSGVKTASNIGPVE